MKGETGLCLTRSLQYHTGLVNYVCGWRMQLQSGFRSMGLKAPSDTATVVGTTPLCHFIHKINKRSFSNHRIISFTITNTGTIIPLIQTVFTVFISALLYSLIYSFEARAAYIPTIVELWSRAGIRVFYFWTFPLNSAGASSGRFHGGV